MAYTIKQDLLDYMPAHNPMPVVLYDNTNYAQTGYKYILDIYVNAVFQTRLKAQPDPIYNYGIFDISRMVAGFLSTGYTGNTTLMWQIPSNKAVTVKAGYEYISGGVITQTLNALTSFTPCTAFLGGFSYLEHSIIMNSPTYYDERLLTSSPIVQTMKTDTRAWFDVINKGTVKDLEVKRYNSAGALIGTDYIANSVSTTASMIRVSYGPAQIAGGGALDLSATSYYTVRLRDNTDALIKTGKTVYVDNDCGRYSGTDVQLHFLNQFGGWDFVYMNKKNSKFTTINRSNIKRDGSTMSSDGKAFWSYQSGDRVSNTTYKNRMILNSDFKNDEEFKWLENLATSPLVYMWDENGTLWIVNITDVEYEHKKFINNKLGNVTLAVEYSLENNRQRF